VWALWWGGVGKKVVGGRGRRGWGRGFVSFLRGGLGLSVDVEVSLCLGLKLFGSWVR